MLPDFGWSELLMVGIVLIVVVGPKDLPRVIKGFGKGLKSVRKMSADFQKQFSDAMDESEMSELRDMARDLKGLDPRSQIKDALNPLGKLGNDVSSDLKKAMDLDDKPVSVPPVKVTKPTSAVDSALAASSSTAKAAQKKPAPKVDVEQAPAAKKTVAKNPQVKKAPIKKAVAKNAPATESAAKKPAVRKKADS